MIHGKRSTYTNHGCHCTACRAENTAYFRRLRRLRAQMSHRVTEGSPSGRGMLTAAQPGRVGTGRGRQNAGTA
jgi:hypothetical protein